MKVLLMTRQVIEDTGSTYRCTANLFDILERFAYLGELHVCSCRFNGFNSHVKIEKDLSRVVKYGNVTFIRKDYIALSRANKVLIKPMVEDSDLVISYGSCPGLFGIARRCRKKYMSYVVSCEWDGYWNHSFLGKVIAPYKFLYAKYTVKHSDYVLYVSNKFLQKRYPTDAKYQAGCSDVKIARMNESTLQNRLNFLAGYTGNDLNIATTAAVDVLYKGQQYVLKAMHELKKKGRDNIHYYLIGGGSQCRLKSLTEKYGLERQVHFLGIVPHDEVFDVLDRMHIYIQPSLQEGLPRSMVEAMSRGLLCIGARTAAIPELIQPEYLTRRKSHSDIISLIETVTKEDMQNQALVNFKEAGKYQEELIRSRRNQFFDDVIKDVIPG